jgi:hypothetical protein
MDEDLHGECGTKRDKASDAGVNAGLKTTGTDSVEARYRQYNFLLGMLSCINSTKKLLTIASRPHRCISSKS